MNDETPAGPVYPRLADCTTGTYYTMAVRSYVCTSFYMMLASKDVIRNMQIVLLSFTVCSITKIRLLPYAVRLVEDSDTPLLYLRILDRIRIH